jgi:hypothetical protein
MEAEMVLELVAIWMIVGVTFFWFFRDEAKRGNARLDAQARRFAAAPHGAGLRKSHEDELTVIQRLHADLLAHDDKADDNTRHAGLPEAIA